MLLFSTSFIGIGQELPTIGKVFNFHIGDEFHYNTLFGPFGTYSISQEKIIDVDYQLDSNEVTYTIAREIYSFIWGEMDSIPFIDTISIEYTNLDLSMFYYDDIFLHDTVHYFSDSLCGAEIYGAHYYGDGPEGSFIIKREWGPGLGLTLERTSSWTGTDLKFLEYYLKDGEECGSPITSVGINENILFSSVSIFPNPNTGQINVDLGSLTDVAIKVLNASGQLIYYKENINSPIYQFELDASPGIYILELSATGEKQQFKLIKQ